MDQAASPKEDRKRLRVLLAEDYVILREGIHRLLESEYDVVGTAADGSELVKNAEQLKPDIVILDVSMPVMNGIEAARKLRHFAPKIKIAFLTQQSSKPYVREAFRAGASAYVLKQSAAAELLPALRNASEGRYYLSQSIAEALAPREMDPSTNPADLLAPALTPRQRELLDLIAGGNTPADIAAQWGISVTTAEYHRDSIMNELGLKTTEELEQYARSHARRP